MKRGHAFLTPSLLCGTENPRPTQSNSLGTIPVHLLLISTDCGQELFFKVKVRKTKPGKKKKTQVKHLFLKGWEGVQGQRLGGDSGMTSLVPLVPSPLGSDFTLEISPHKAGQSPPFWVMGYWTKTESMWLVCTRGLFDWAGEVKNSLGKECWSAVQIHWGHGDSASHGGKSDLTQPFETLPEGSLEKSAEGLPSGTAAP